MFSENDLKQIKNLVNSFYTKHKYYPLAENLIQEYQIFFPENLDQETIDQIDNLINEIIVENISKKWTKWWKIMSKILKYNENLWKDFRKLNKENLTTSEEFQKLWKKMERLIEQWESQLTEKLIWDKSMWIEKASNAWYDMVYAIFPEWNQIK